MKKKQKKALRNPTSRPGITSRYKEFDVAVERLFKKARGLGSVIPCSRGCSACCNEAVLLTHMEMPPLIETLRAMAVEKRSAIKRRLIGWFNRMEAHGISMVGEPDRSTYYRAQVACPLLDPANQTCLVYSARPIACRAHHIVDASPDVCAAVGTNPRTPALVLNDQITIPFLQALLSDQSCPEGQDLMMAMGVLPALLWAVWSLVENPELSISQWLERTNREGLPLSIPAKEAAGAG